MKLINCEQSDIDPIALYYLHLEFLKADEITLAHQAAIEALEFRELDIKKRIDLLWFFVRYDDGYKFISRYCDQFISYANQEEKLSIKSFLSHLIKLRYLEKIDLSSHLISHLISE